MTSRWIDRIQVLQYYRATAVVCWTFPLAMVILLLSAEQLGFGSDLYCTRYSSQHVTFSRGQMAVEAHGADDFDTWKLSCPFCSWSSYCYLHHSHIREEVIIVHLMTLRSSKGIRLLKRITSDTFVVLFFVIYLFLPSTRYSSSLKHKQYQAYERDYFTCLTLDQGGSALFAAWTVSSREKV